MKHDFSASELSQTCLLRAMPKPSNWVALISRIKQETLVYRVLFPTYSVVHSFQDGFLWSMTYNANIFLFTPVLGCELEAQIPSKE